MQLQELIDKIHSEGLAFAMGSSPHPADRPVHTIYAHVAKNYFRINTDSKIGRAYGSPTLGASVLQQAYDNYKALNEE